MKCEQIKLKSFYPHKILTSDVIRKCHNCHQFSFCYFPTSFKVIFVCNSQMASESSKRRLCSDLHFIAIICNNSLDIRYFWVYYSCHWNHNLACVSIWMPKFMYICCAVEIVAFMEESFWNTLSSISSNQMTGGYNHSAYNLLSYYN